MFLYFTGSAFVVVYLHILISDLTWGKNTVPISFSLAFNERQRNKAAIRKWL